MNRRSFLCQLAGSGMVFIAGDLLAEKPSILGLRRMTFSVEGVEREAFVAVPKAGNSGNVPVVFCFHGHGGGGLQAAQSFQIHREWPEALCVYMQGLNTPGRLTDPEGKKTGWQSGVGDQNDRDLKFFDVLLEQLKKEFKIDRRRIYSMGHSNGGAFTYLLWETRADLFAAFAPSGAFTRNARKLKAKPALHIAGQMDPLVKYEWQKLTMDAVRRTNECGTKGVELDKFCTLYSSRSGTPFVAFLHGGGHEFPEEAPAAMVRFFKEQVLP